MSDIGEITDIAAGSPTDDADGAQVLRPHAAEAAAPRRSHRRAIASAASTLLLGAAAWWGAGAYFGGKSSQEAANAWDGFRTCLLGDGMRGGVQPSEHMRRITMAIAHTPEAAQWPRRCAAHAQRLDAALAVRELRERLGALPQAAAIVAGTAGPSDVDLLHSELELADLPLPERDPLSGPVAPEPAEPVLRATDLAALGKVVELGTIDAAIDGAEGRILRLLLPEKMPLVCRFNDGPREQRWQSAACRTAPMSARPSDRLRLTRSDPGAPDLIQVDDTVDRNGIYDASTGQVIWRPRYFDAQATVHASGESTIFYADMRTTEEREKVEQFRLLKMVPGKRPASRRLSIPPHSRALLWPEALLYWSTDANEEKRAKDELFAAPLRTDMKDPLGEPLRVGDLPPKSRVIDDCASAGMRIALLVSGIQDRRYSLVFQRNGDLLPPLDVGGIDGKLALSCHEGAAMLLRVGRERIARWKCDPKACVQALSPALPMIKGALVAAASLGDEVALAWLAHGQPLRLRVARADALHEARDTVVLDDELHGGVAPVAMRMIGADGLAVLLLQDAGSRVFALRVRDDDPTPVRVVR